MVISLTSSNKRQYAYLLTPKGIREKSILAQSFIKRKRHEFEQLKIEIATLLEEEVGITNEVSQSNQLGEILVTELTCFKAYDIRGEINVNIDEQIVYSVGRAVAQHFDAKSIIVGFDARETSPSYAKAAASGIVDAGANVLNVGLAGTEEMYWAVNSFGACAGIEITASHNPINFNGMKIVKSGAQPLDEKRTFRR